MKTNMKIDFVPYLGIGIGTQRTMVSRDILFFLPFIVIELSIKKIKS
jgi:hypothetical protein